MVTDELVSFELAKLSKKKGFNEEWFYSYTTDDKSNIDLHSSFDLTGEFMFTEEDLQAAEENEYSAWFAPTRAFLQKWLREEHKIDILPTMSKNSRTYGYRIFCIEDGKTIEYVHIYEKHETYELALEQGLIEGLNLIKNERTINKFQDSQIS